MSLQIKDRLVDIDGIRSDVIKLEELAKMDPYWCRKRIMSLFNWINYLINLNDCDDIEIDRELNSYLDDINLISDDLNGEFS